MCRWNVMSSTSTTMSLGNPVVQNLRRKKGQEDKKKKPRRSVLFSGKMEKKIRSKTKEGGPSGLPCLAFGAGLLSSHFLASFSGKSRICNTRRNASIHGSTSTIRTNESLCRRSQTEIEAPALKFFLPSSSRFPGRP